MHISPDPGTCLELPPDRVRGQGSLPGTPFAAILSVMVSWPMALALFLGALLLHLEIVRRDFQAPKPPDPFRQDRIRGGESLDPDAEVAPNPRFPDRA